MNRTQIINQTIRAIYNWIDLQIAEQPALAGICRMCGRCCDFELYGHRLFVTTAEAEYLLAHLGRDKIKPMLSRRCPYNLNGRCTIYTHRFAACRIFCCQADKDFQSYLTEQSLSKIKAMCRDYAIPYRYLELSEALNSLAVNIHQPAGQYCREDTAD